VQHQEKSNQLKSNSMSSKTKKNPFNKRKTSAIKEIKPIKGIKEKLKSPRTSYLNDLLFKEHEDNFNSNNNSMQLQF